MELQPIKNGPNNEAHIIERVTGHVLSTDCWCEPQGY